MWGGGSEDVGDFVTDIYGVILVLVEVFTKGEKGPIVGDNFNPTPPILSYVLRLGLRTRPGTGLCVRAGSTGSYRSLYEFTPFT